MDHTVFVTPKQSKDNYHTWACAMRKALGGKNKLSFADGSVEIPSETYLNRMMSSSIYL